MDEKRLSKRLARVRDLAVEHTESPRRLVDIGSDHAYLPIYMVLNQDVEAAIAGEVVQGPYDSSLRAVTANQLSDQIDVRLGDGLEVLKDFDDFNVMTICGMGGGVIASILEKGRDRLSGEETLVLQPNVEERSVRQWLATHSYEIIAEDLLDDAGKRYEIIVAQKAAREFPLSPKEVLAGPHLLKERSALFLEKWQHEKEHLERVVQAIQTSGDSPQNQERLQMMKEQLALVTDILKEDGHEVE